MSRVRVGVVTHRPNRRLRELHGISNSVDDSLRDSCSFSSAKCFSIGIYECCPACGRQIVEMSSEFSVNPQGQQRARHKQG